MARFTRHIEAAPLDSVTPYLLPMRGSGSKAFVDMGIRWRDDYDAKKRLRRVMLPGGFTVENTDGDLLAIIDSAGYPRAVIRSPKGDIPLITPVRRFKPDAEVVAGGCRMLIREWNNVLVRGAVFETGVSALAAGTEWLNANKPGWESYVSRVNFRVPPPRWKLFV